MPMMEYRHDELGKVLDGLNHTQVPLIAEYKGYYQVAGYGDDQGLYYFIPSIAKFFGISLEHAIDVFFGSLWFIATMMAICSFLLIFKHWNSRLISTLGLLMLAFIATHYRDVYSAFFFAVVATVPLFILSNQKKYGFNLFVILALAFSAVVSGYCNYVRCYSGTGVLLFIVLWICLNENLAIKEKILSALVLSAFVCIPFFHFTILEDKRDTFLKNIQPTYQKIQYHICFLNTLILHKLYAIWDD